MIGTGGVGMAGLAFLLKKRGHEISGCDGHASPRTAWLEENGVAFFGTHSPDHVETADEIIVTPAVPADMPELVRARELGSRIRRRGEVLAELVNSADSVAVCGSHGKTTTATWTARLLLALGERVEWCIGGETGDFPVAGAQGPSDRAPVMVVEADESDGTLALYRARTLLVTNCEYDHPDHFATREDYVACYDTARSQAGVAIECESLPPLTDGATAACLATLPAHNARNARGAVEIALRRGHGIDAVAEVLPRIVADLPDRRFQTVSPPNAPLVIADYAHHPTEMACAVSMARQVCRGRLRVLFQPHRYSRTKFLLAGFPPALAGADEVILCPTYAAFEQPIEGGDVTDLYAACREYGKPSSVDLAASCDEAWRTAKDRMREGDVTLLLGAGDIIKLADAARSSG